LINTWRRGDQTDEQAKGTKRTLPEKFNKKERNKLGTEVANGAIHKRKKGDVERK